MADDLFFSSIAEVARRYRSGESAPVALTRVKDENEKTATRESAHAAPLPAAAAA